MRRRSKTVLIKGMTALVGLRDHDFKRVTAGADEQPVKVINDRARIQ